MAVCGTFGNDNDDTFGVTAFNGFGGTVQALAPACTCPRGQTLSECRRGKGA